MFVLLQTDDDGDDTNAGITATTVINAEGFHCDHNQAAALAAIAEVNCEMKFSPRTAAVSAVDSVQDAANGLLALEWLTVGDIQVQCLLHPFAKPRLLDPANRFSPAHPTYYSALQLHQTARHLHEARGGAPTSQRLVGLNTTTTLSKRPSPGRVMLPLLHSFPRPAACKPLVFPFQELPLHAQILCLAGCERQTTTGPGMVCETESGGLDAINGLKASVALVASTRPLLSLDFCGV